MSLCNYPTFQLPSPPDILSILLSLLPSIPKYPSIQLPSLPCPLDAAAVAAAIVIPTP